MRLSPRPILAALLPLALLSPLTAAEQKPNVIILYTDDLGYGDISCYGADAIKTPNIDHLAANGLRFTNGYAAASTCTPSRYALLSGHLPFRKKGTGVLPGDAHLIINPNQQTLPKIFQSAGYTTACIGKWHLGLGDKQHGAIDWNKKIPLGPNEIGFDYSWIIPATNDRVPCVYLENGRVANLDPKDPLYVDYHKKIGNEPTAAEFPDKLKYQTPKGDHHHGTIHGNVGRIGFMTGGHAARWNDETMADTLVAKAKNFIQSQHGKPFFLYFSTVDIHAPRLYHPRFAGKSQLGPRGDMILQLDDCVGQLTQFLEQQKLLDNTLIIFSSDNGPKLEDAYMDGSLAAAKKLHFNPAGPLRGTKYSLLEGGHRVPFIAYWKGHITPAVSDAMIGQVDLLASFASMTGQSITHPEVSDSQNHLTALLGKSPTARTTMVYGQHGNLIRQGDWKLINTKQPQLYNLKTDSAEKHNLAKKHPEIVHSLKKILQQEVRRYHLK